MKKADEARLKKIHMLTLAFAIAFLPPFWAVLSPYVGVRTGAVALIVAGLYATNGNRRKDAVKITLGFLLGDLFSVTAIWFIENLPFSADINTYLILFVLGAAAVLIGETLPGLVFTPALLCGWAIGLTIMAPLGTSAMGTLPLQIAAAMVAGVLYVGIGVDLFQKWLVRLIIKEDSEDPSAAS